VLIRQSARALLAYSILLALYVAAAYPGGVMVRVLRAKRQRGVDLAQAGSALSSVVGLAEIVYGVVTEVASYVVIGAVLYAAPYVAMRVALAGERALRRAAQSHTQVIIESRVAIIFLIFFLAGVPFLMWLARDDAERVQHGLTPHSRLVPWKGQPAEIYWKPRVPPMHLHGCHFP
jgi:hypothetical protein